MRTNRTALMRRLAVATGLAGCAAMAGASTVMQVADLEIFRDGGLTDWLSGNRVLLDDRFDNGNPLQGPLFNGSTDVSTYTLLGVSDANRAAALSEAGGLLSLVPALSEPSVGATGGVGLSMRLRLNTNVADPNRGLPLTRSFAAAAALPLSAMPDPGYQFGIRFTDGYGGNNANDVIELNLGRNAGGALVLTFRKQDFQAGVITTFGSVPVIPPTGAQALALVLTHPVANDPTIGAGWVYIDDNGGMGFNAFEATTVAFRGEAHTLLEFRAVTAVPEPGTWALFAAGLALVGLRSARRPGAGARPSRAAAGP